MSTATLYERRKNIVPSALGVFSPASVVSAQGAIITDADGREMIDFAGGIGVLNAGHCPAPVVKAIQDQAAKLIHSSFNVAIYEVYLELAEKLAELFPHHETEGDSTKVMLVNTGAEAVENAIKIARQATGRQGIICFENAFHGRSMMAMTLTSKVGYKTGCGPFAPETYRLPYPYYGPTQWHITEEVYVIEQIAALKHFFQTQVAASQVAAIIMETVQGEGGFYPAPVAYLQALRQLCNETGIMLIMDEVQSGFGRTGDWAAYNFANIRPDISTWAKSMGSGMPIGCVIARTSVIDRINGGTIGGTYAGNPVCAAASLATIKYMEEIDINAKGRHVGQIVRTRFEGMQNRFPSVVGDVRGLGAMLALELVKDGDLGKPDGDLCKKVVQYANDNGLILISAGVYGNVIRVLSPLVISDEDLMKGLDIIEAGIATNI